MERILIIEDNESIKKLLVWLFKDKGYETVSASNGLEGKKMLLESPIDLVITDIVMPQKDGLELIVELRKVLPEIMIIAISGDCSFGAETFLDTAKACGVRKVFEKPFELNRLYEAAEELLVEKRRASIY